MVKLMNDIIYDESGLQIGIADTLIKEKKMHNARIIAVTEPRIWTDAPDVPQRLTVDEFIAYVARVSNPSNQNNTLTASKLLRY